jgi:hypothetical protein
MTSWFERFRNKRQESENKDDAARRQWQDRDGRIAQIIEESRGVLEHYRQQGNGKLHYLGTTGFRLEIPLHWTFGVVKLEGQRLTVYVESNPAKSSGYACDDFTRVAQPPALPDEWAGPQTMRDFLDRAFAIFEQRYDKGTMSSTIVGP